MKAAEFDDRAGIYCGFQGDHSRQQTQFIKLISDKLQDLNPELQTVQTHHHAHAMRDGIFGAATQFTPDDLRFFIDYRMQLGPKPAALRGNMNPDYAVLENAIALRTHVKMQWLAAPENLLKIYAQVRDRPASPNEAACKSAFATVINVDYTQRDVDETNRFMSRHFKLKPTRPTSRRVKLCGEKGT